MRISPARVAITSTVLATSLAMTTPAFACGPGDPEGADYHGTMTLAELQSKVDRAITVSLDWLQQLDAKVASDDHLSDAKKTRVEHRIAQASDALQSLKTSVDADTTKHAVRTDLRHFARAHQAFFFRHRDGHWSHHWSHHWRDHRGWRGERHDYRH